MKNILGIINYLFAVLLTISCLLLTVVIIYTFLDLSKNTYFDISSRDSIENFISSFNWCKSIISSVFIMFSVFYVFQTFRVHYENKLFNNYILPKEKSLNEKLQIIKLNNIELYNFAIRNGREIMRIIISKEKNNRIENKPRLEYYYNKFVKNEIDDFECSGHYGRKCLGNCITCNQTRKTKNSTNSFDQFNLIAFDLFCISFEYSDFEKDIKSIYEESRRK
jgi:hypothetical protein